MIIQKRAGPKTRLSLVPRLISAWYYVRRKTARQRHDWKKYKYSQLINKT